MYSLVVFSGKSLNKYGFWIKQHQKEIFFACGASKRNFLRRQRLEDFDRSIEGYFSIGRKTSGEIL